MFPRVLCFLLLLFSEYPPVYRCLLHWGTPLSKKTSNKVIAVQHECLHFLMPGRGKPKNRMHDAERCEASISQKEEVFHSLPVSFEWGKGWALHPMGRKPGSGPPPSQEHLSSPKSIPKYRDLNLGLTPSWRANCPLGEKTRLTKPLRESGQAGEWLHDIGRVSLPWEKRSAGDSSCGLHH